jgi:hypothetical protein
LADVVEHLDPEARWAGDSLLLPTLRIHLHLESLPAMRNVSLGSVGPNQSQSGWRRLERALADALARVEVPRNPYGALLALAGVLIGTGLALAVYRDPEAVAQALFEMLRLGH